VLTGSFVALRPLEPGDAEITLQWRQSARAALLRAGAETAEQQRAWIASRPDTERNFIIELRDGRPVGMLSLVDIDHVNRRAESGRFLIGEEDAVRGVPAAVESMLLLYQLAFDELGLERIYGIVAADNRRMIKWQRYLGMQEEGRLRQHLFIDGRPCDVVCLGLLAAEYHSVARPSMTALIAAARPLKEHAA
jgi:diamine N-acetyltransferase